MPSQRCISIRSADCGSAAWAEQVVSTLTCDGDNGGLAFTLSFYALYFDIKSDEAFYFSADAEASRYNQLALQELSNATYIDCTLSGSNIYTYKVTFEDVAALVTPSGSYALATFSFNGISLGSSIKAPAKKAAITAEEGRGRWPLFDARTPPLVKDEGLCHDLASGLTLAVSLCTVSSRQIALRGAIALGQLSPGAARAISGLA